MIAMWRGWILVLALAFTIAGISSGLLNPYLQQILFYIAINIMLAASLNLVNGFCGQFSLGHAGFMAVGAYVSALISLNFHPFSGAVSILNFPVYVMAGGLCAALAGFVVGMPSLRLRGDYLAIVTLGFGEIIRVVLLNLEIVGGARGLYGIPGDTDFLACVHAFFWAGATVLLLWRLVHSSYGRAFLSVREDEIAAECMGINTTRTKVTAFVVSSFFAGAAGAIFAHTTNSLNPASFQFVKSVDVVIMVVLGGMGSLSGSVLGAILVTILPEALRPLQEYTGVDLRMVIYSAALILLMILKPGGILGGREWTHFWRRRVT
ncbi:MAG TPA: branched-chain amino acid ABC transporter permease [Bdellovibrionales bacterium]|nr:branched-chain amino acid ABC transporter permease [Bdellovibrionales bacterium]